MKSNEKGFTLVELIGVLVILSIIMVIVATPIIGQIRNQKGRISNAAKDMILGAVDEYLDDNVSIYPKKNGSTYYISVSVLLDNGYLAEEFLDNTDGVEGSTLIQVKAEYNGYTTSIYQIEENSDIYNIEEIYEELKNSSMYSYMGGSYLKGPQSNNYILFSGMLWRIMGINEDNSIRLIANEAVTTLNYGPSTITSFKNTYVYEWLNDYYLSRISNYDVLVKFPYCYYKATSTSNTDYSNCYKNGKATDKTTSAKVGLLTLEEYNLSKESGVTYLDYTYPFATLTPASNTTYHVLSNSNTYQTGAADAYYYIRPVINVDPNTIVFGGEGTSTNPYVLNKSITENNYEGRTIKDTYIVPGDYVKFGGIVTRVIDINDDDVKIIRNAYNTSSVFETAPFSDTSNDYSISAGIGSILNNEIYNALFVGYSSYIRTAVWYQGKTLGSDINNSYRFTSLARANLVYSVKVGLPKIGELMTIPLGTSEYWTLTKADDTTNLITISATGPKSAAYTASKGVREVIVISTDFLVESGLGTPNNPYVLAVE